ncbi:MAG: metallophosphoesterase family protein [Abditibacteriota bacterium]|nr:metallophosphoesterase family protein [Abditibacteriota bacterium]
MRFLCASDLHLGRSSSVPSNPKGLDLSAAGALMRLADKANRENADWLLLAGDICDKGENEYAAQLMLQKAIDRMSSNIRIAMISGNHDEDSLERICGRLAKNYPDRVYFLNGKMDIGEGLSLLGYPYNSVDPEGVKQRLLKECDSSAIVLFHGDHRSAAGKYGGLTDDERRELATRSYFTVCGHNHYPEEAERGFINCGSPQALDAYDGGGSEKWHGAWMTENGEKTRFVPISNVCYVTVDVDIKDEPFDAFEEAEEAVPEGLSEFYLVTDVRFTGWADDLKKTFVSRSSSLDQLPNHFNGLNTLVRSVENLCLPKPEPGDYSPVGVLWSLITDRDLPEGFASREDLLMEADKLIDEMTGAVLKEYEKEFSPEEKRELVREAAVGLLQSLIIEEGKK